MRTFCVLIFFGIGAVQLTMRNPVATGWSMSSSHRNTAKAGLPKIALLLAIALGTLFGIGGTTFHYAQGLSYFRTDPRACANCHIMQTQLDSWQKSSHHGAAVCVDCHLPSQFFAKYLTKAENGWRHGKLFTAGGFREPIEVAPRGREILETNCIRCHGELTAPIRTDAQHASNSGQSCLHCHFNVGHGPRAGLGGPETASEKAQTPAVRN